MIDKDCVMTSESLTKIVVKFRNEKILCVFVSCIKHPFEGHNVMHKNYRVAVP